MLSRNFLNRIRFQRFSTSSSLLNAPHVTFPLKQELKDDEKIKFEQPFPPTFSEMNLEGQKEGWLCSFHGIAKQGFSKEIAEVLMQDISEEDVEIKPDGLLYLPEIKYRRILNKAFGPGGWGILPRSPHSVIGRTLTREYALICQGRFVSQSRGEQDFFSPEGLPTATEGVKSNALMRCCKDLGIASELWDPVFIKKWKTTYATEVWVLDQKAKQKKKLWRKKTDTFNTYPYIEQ